MCELFNEPKVDKQTSVNNEYKLWSSPRIKERASNKRGKISRALRGKQVEHQEYRQKIDEKKAAAEYHY